MLTDHALQIWHAGVAAVAPGRLVREAIAALPTEWKANLDAAPRILVVGCGKAGAAMAVAAEGSLRNHLGRVEGVVNVPNGFVERTERIRLHAARPVGSNHPTAAGVAGAEDMLRLLASAGPDDVALCLISGGGSALLPCPVEGISLADKQAVTKILHASGATIVEMNAVRKHLSRVKGGRLAEAFRGKRLISLVISDVVGDPLDVIASGPTASDPTTFADAIAVLERYGLTEKSPPAVIAYLRRGADGHSPETPKALPGNVHNVIVGSNAKALESSRAQAETLGYNVLNLGPNVEGDTSEVAVTVAGIASNIRDNGIRFRAPACVLIGGETTVTLGPSPGKGGRNQEFVLAALTHLGEAGLRNLCVLSGGTDGEDGPTDAAGAWATTETARTARSLGLNPEIFLARHDAYPFFERVGSLLKTGLTGTNVMDLRIILVGDPTV
jgi:hydroxypyruvate reductase/glycerate 2-kinase